MFGGLAGAQAASFTPQGGGQILSHLLPLSLLQVVFGGVLEMGLHLCEKEVGLNIGAKDSGLILKSSLSSKVVFVS